MPGMDMNLGASPWLALAEIALFWSAAVVHLLRLLSRPWLPDTDALGDAGHALMAAGMVYMVFPAAPDQAEPVLGLAFAALAVLFAGSALRRRSAGHRLQHAAVAGGQAAMALMLTVHGRPGALVTAPIAGMLLACAAVHAWSWFSRHTLAHAAAPIGGGRVLVTLPHLGALATTLAMAAMVAAA